jgi:PHD/YefM family antitoxin component YafN of YafNO toxin-antitoxin module
MSDENASTAVADEELMELSRRVARGHTRVQIELSDGDGPCVIISKAELDGLERALAILSDQDNFKSACGCLQKIAAACESQQGA